MQLKNRRIVPALSAASYALVNAPVQAQWPLPEADYQTGVMIYSEDGGRVSLIEPVAKARFELDEDEFLDLQVVVDTLTGATPNGTPAAGSVQTFTTPSGNSSYTAAPGETPLDETFHDTRVALSLNWDRPLDRLTRLGLSTNLSSEYDYTSFGVGGSLSRDVNARQTTLSASLGFSQDQISPVGGKPIAFAEMAPAGAAQPKSGDASKQVFDLLLGATQVLSRSTLLQLSYSLTQQDGYQTDPYKLVSVIDGDSGLPTGDYLYEKRPDSRTRQALYAKVAHHFDAHIAHLSYRYYRDDWGLDSSTIELRYRIPFADDRYLQPHVRWYRQSAVDFYAPSLIEDKALPEFATGDYRLGAFDSITLGLKYGVELSRDSELSFRAEWIEQSGDSQPDSAIGDQRNQDLFPTVKAMLMQVGYSFHW